MLLGAFSIPVLVVRIRDFSELPLLYVRDYRFPDRVLYLVQKLVIVVSSQDSDLVSGLTLLFGDDLLCVLRLEAYACCNDVLLVNLVQGLVEACLQLLLELIRLVDPELEFPLVAPGNLTKNISLYRILQALYVTLINIL